MWAQGIICKIRPMPDKFRETRGAGRKWAKEEKWKGIGRGEEKKK